MSGSKSESNDNDEGDEGGVFESGVERAGAVRAGTVIVNPVAAARVHERVFGWDRMLDARRRARFACVMGSEDSGDFREQEQWDMSLLF